MNRPARSSSGIGTRCFAAFAKPRPLPHWCFPARQISAYCRNDRDIAPGYRLPRFEDHAALDRLPNLKLMKYGSIVAAVRHHRDNRAQPCIGSA